MIDTRGAAMGEHEDACDLFAGADGLQQMLPHHARGAGNENGFTH
jgi:hypothetical protein